MSILETLLALRAPPGNLAAIRAVAESEVQLSVAGVYWGEH